MTLLAIHYSLLCLCSCFDIHLYTDSFCSSQLGSCSENPA